MGTRCNTADRRLFLKASLAGGLAAAGAARLTGAASAAGENRDGSASRVAVTSGNDRAAITFEGLKPFEQEIARAIGNRRVVIKPNNVAIDIQLAATHVDCLEGILEFLKSIGKLDGAVIAESAAPGATLEGFANYGYPGVAAKYGVKLLDLDQEPYDVLHVIDEKDFRPHPVRMSRLLLDPNSFVISAARMKTHDLVVATLSLKNIIFGAPIKDPGFGFGKQGKPGAKSDKRIAHGGGIHGINYNLFALAWHLHPHLAVIDGYEGMEGYGPTRGTAVEHRVCVVGTDWLAADRVAVELMGVDFAKIGYLNYCAQAGLGEGDLKKIEIVGEPLARHVKTYKLAPNIDQQLTWMKPAVQS
ncbi:MAG: DUF362 domain-containing protein [Pirellulales bacterium]|nr:DUF362 domain-containing protein [Pirellulales bacterium]